MTKALQHLQTINVNDEYGTPINIYENGVKLAGFRPLLDVAASKQNHRCAEYYTAQDNALTKEWNQDFWMNPPYSRVKEFISYGYNEHIRHNVNALILTFAKTDTRWWHQYVEGKAQVHFIEGRIKFLNEYGMPTRHPAPYPSCFIVWRKK